MNFRDLEYFCAICKEKSYTKAAECLHLSQPSLTLSIKRLEQELNTPLFHRSKRKKEVELTEAGEVFLQHSHTILQQIDDAYQDMRRFNNAKVLLGLPPILGAYFFPPILAEIVEKYPSLQLDIVEEGSLNLIKALKNNEIDLAILTLMEGQQWDFLETKKLGEDQLYFCFAKNHPLAQRQSVALQETEKEKYILLSSDFAHYSHIMREFERAEISPTVVLTSSKMQTIKHMVASGIGISLMTGIALKSHTDIVMVPATGCSTNVDIVLAWKRHAQLSAPAQNLQRHIAGYKK